MEGTFPLLFATVVGFSHAFEADHLVAVSNIVTRSNRIVDALKDGAFWGLGHTSTIFLIGIIMIAGKATFLNNYFGYFEAGVGVMLVLIGIFRLIQFQSREDISKHSNQDTANSKKNLKLAYGVGLIHGLAGSGTLILLVMSEIEGVGHSLLYLLLFGLGSVVGMLAAAALLGLPFARNITNQPILRRMLVVASSLLCIGYGSWVFYENMLV